MTKRLAVLFSILSLCLQAASPTQAELDAYLQQAAAKWGVTAPDTTIRLEPTKSCGLYNAAHHEKKKDITKKLEASKSLIGLVSSTDRKPHKSMATSSITFDGDENGEKSVATTDHQQHKGTTTLTTSEPAGNSDESDEPVLIDQDTIKTETHVSNDKVFYTNVVRINGACNWDDREFLGKVILHEYGHALGIIDHSQNDRDIMYWLVFNKDAAALYGTQTVTAFDQVTVADLDIAGKKIQAKN